MSMVGTHYRSMVDPRLWLAPSNRQCSTGIPLGDVSHLEQLVRSGEVPVSRALKVPRFKLYTSACRPDGSCGLRMGCLARLLGAHRLTPQTGNMVLSRSWLTCILPSNTTQRQILNSLSADTKAKVAGTIHWFDDGAKGFSSPDFWFTIIDIHAVIDYAVNIPPWHCLHSPNRLNSPN